MDDLFNFLLSLSLSLSLSHSRSLSLPHPPPLFPVTAMASNCTLQFLDEPPGHIRVRPGSSLTLYCSSSTCPGAAGRMAWYFSGSEGAVSKKTLTGIHESSEDKIWCNYTIGNVQVNDSGRYLCKLTQDRPVLRQQERETRVVVGKW